MGGRRAVTESLRGAASGVALYGASVRHVFPRGRRAVGPRRAGEERLVFVVGSPRSGTTFLAGAIGGAAGCVDLGELAALKAAIPGLVSLPDAAAADRIRRILERVRALSFVRGLRGVEQTPETAFVLEAALRAYPEARAVHIARDGRDVVCSLLERGWLSAGRGGQDDAHQPFGSYARFWVEPERVDEFGRSSDARRAAWAWRRYVEAARTVPARTLEVRYEEIVADPPAAAARIADYLDVDVDPLAERLRAAHGRSIGRYERELTAEQLADVVGEAGELLAELGFGGSAPERATG